MNRAAVALAAVAVLLAGCTEGPDVDDPYSSSSERAGTPTSSASASPLPLQCRPRDEVLPDPACTPGALNPAVDADAPAYSHTICKSGWTATVRPSTQLTNAVKRWQLAGDYTGDLRRLVARLLRVDPDRVRVGVYGFYGGGVIADYELDHFVPLGFGGATDDPANLWVEYDARSNPKDKVETAGQRWICRGKVEDRPGRLATVRRLVVEDWRKLAELLKVKIR